MRTFSLTAFAFAALAATAHAEELRTSNDEQTCRADEAEAAELRSSCPLTNDGCWYTSGCGTAHYELGSGNIEAMLNGCHIPEMPDNCMWWRNQVGSVDVYVSGSLCSISAGATNDPGPATGLNWLIDQIINAPIPNNAVITGYDVLGVSPFGPVSERGHVRVHYRVVVCQAEAMPMEHSKIVDPNPLAP